MKIIFTLSALMLVSVCYSQTGQWTWMKGDSIRNGNAKPTSYPGNVTWTDLSGNFWLFGGISSDDAGQTFSTNDLWKYDPLTNLWNAVSVSGFCCTPTAYGIKGVPSPNNHPAARGYSVSWTGTAGDLWLFGGNGSTVDPTTGFSFRSYADLWKYNIASNQWTWMGGGSMSYAKGNYGVKYNFSDTTHPGARFSSVGWSDATGNLYLFGGEDYIGGDNKLNDVWQYNITLKKWRWESGDSSKNSKGVYGSKGVASPFNKPGARTYAAVWKDANGAAWFFGGQGYSNSSAGVLSDIWKYNGSWTWMGGDSSVGVRPVYGTKGASSPTNNPGARTVQTYRHDAANNLWVWGGNANNANDLWKYTANTHNWTWISGDSIENKWGVYGVQGVAALTNIPCSRYNASTWNSLTDDFWLFGGNGYDTVPWSSGRLNDLWKFLSSSTLPVHLLTFTARLQQDKVNLNWQVQNEQNFDRYEVERSYDSREFVKIGSLKCKGGNGSKHEYNYSDHGPWSIAHGLIYYRVKMLDKDGKFMYSNVENVMLPAHNSLLTIYPNPATNNVQLQLNRTINGRVTVEVVDEAGKVVISKGYNVMDNNITVSIQNLAKGNYNVRLLYNNEQYVQNLVVLR